VLFRSDRAPAPQELDPQEPDEGGLGLAIIRALTDDLAIGPRSGGGGYCVRFTKSLS